MDHLFKIFLAITIGAFSAWIFFEIYDLFASGWNIGAYFLGFLILATIILWLLRQAWKRLMDEPS